MQTVQFSALTIVSVVGSSSFYEENILEYFEWDETSSFMFHGWIDWECPPDSRF